MIQIHGYDNYLADKSGRIYSLKIKSFLSPIRNQSGYYYVILQNKGVKKKALIHRLVANCFIPLDNERPFVNHIDGIKTNNSVSNLEWCTSSENVKHSYRIGLAKVSDETIKRITILGKESGKKVIDTSTNIIYNSARIAATEVGVNYKTLHGYLANRYKNKTTLIYV